MVPSLLARVDGLPVTLLDREVVWPNPTPARNRRRLPAGRRARIERETAVVHAAVVPSSVRAMLDGCEPVVGTFFAAAATVEEDAEIREALAAGGLL